jgi:glycogen(starch) synthase
MNICLVSSEYPPERHVGGIGTYTYNVARSLAKIGHEVHVVTSTRGVPGSQMVEGVHVHRILDVRVRPQELRLLYYAHKVAKTIAGIQHEFDIVQASEFRGEALVHAMRKRSPLVTRLATPFYLTERLNGRGSGASRPVWNWMERSQTVRSDGVLSSTRVLARTVEQEWRMDPSRVEVIPNSVDVERIRRLGTAGEVPAALRDGEYLIYFGRLEERKGVHILADALQPVLENFPNLRMVFVGGDSGYRGTPMRDHIVERIAGRKANLVFFDNLAQEELFPLVRHAKMVVLPSLWEAFGFVCVEAMALGRPVVASSGSGFEEIIQDGVSGHLVPPGNATALAEKITACLRDEEGLARVSCNADVRACDFQTSRVVPRLVDYYERVREAWRSGAKTRSGVGGEGN